MPNRTLTRAQAKQILMAMEDYGMNAEDIAHNTDTSPILRKAIQKLVNIRDRPISTST